MNLTGGNTALGIATAKSSGQPGVHSFPLSWLESGEGRESEKNYLSFMKADAEQCKIISQHYFLLCFSVNPLSSKQVERTETRLDVSESSQGGAVQGPAGTVGQLLCEFQGTMTPALSSCCLTPGLLG